LILKKLFLFAVVLMLVFSLFACDEVAPPDMNIEDPTNFKIAMITDVGDIDDKSFNQGTWEGIVEFAVANNKEHEYFKPLQLGTADYVDAIDLAVSQGFRIIVTPGFLFEEAIWDAQSKYPNVFFILIDGAPHSGNWTPDIKPNTLSIFFNEHESGFLGGYAAVKEGFTQLGFLGGMAVPAVVRFGVGFVGGAYYAAYEMGLEDFSFPAAYYDYLGDFGPSDEHKNKALGWFNDGVEVIHAAAGGAGNSVMAAAEELDDKWVIGVDIDQSIESDKVITSALKGLAVSVQMALTDIYEQKFVGGRSIVLGAAEDAVGLPTEVDSFAYFNSFTREHYLVIFRKLAAGVVGAPVSPDQLEKYIEALGYQVPTGLIAKTKG
jgi:basic membrane protein A and related proteins